MEGKKFNTGFIHEFKPGFDFGFGQIHRAVCSEGFIRSSDTEHIRTVGAKGVPPGHGKTQVILHLASGDFFIRIVELES